MRKLIPCLALAAFAATAQAEIRITEWMYDGADGEFIEFTNTGLTPIDLTGWSFDDSGRTPGFVDLSAFGVLAAGESAILAEPSAEAFRANWGLADTVKVIGDNGRNLGRGDEINIYDASETLVDRLTYADNGSAGGPRTQNASGWAELDVIGTNNAPGWILSTVGDALGSWAGSGGSIGNPGTYFAPVPEPSTYATIAGVLVLGLAARRRYKTRQA